MKTFHVVCKGRCALWCQKFWCVNEDGTIGDPRDSRKPTPEERQQCLADIRAAREKLNIELAELESAEKALLKRSYT